MYSYEAFAVAAAVPMAGSVRATGPIPGWANEVLPYEAVRQDTSEPLTDVTVHGNPTAVTVTSETRAPAGKSASCRVIKVPPAVEPRRGEIDVTVGVCTSL